MLQRLRERIDELEREERFEGHPYPHGITGFPRSLVGQGFFPGGDGLWREKDRLKEPSNIAFPERGIMFLGNDFGTFENFKKLKLHENPPTWWRLRQRIERAGIDGKIGFFTNAYLGLRTDKAALADSRLRKASEENSYRELCAEFQRFQVATQSPRLIVILGSRPASLFEYALSSMAIEKDTIQRHDFAGHSLTILLSTHPYSDMSKTDDAKTKEAAILSSAWKNVKAR